MPRGPDVITGSLQREARGQRSETGMRGQKQRRDTPEQPLEVGRSKGRAFPLEREEERDQPHLDFSQEDPLQASDPLK